MKPQRTIIQTRKKTIQFPQSLIPSEYLKQNEIVPWKRFSPTAFIDYMKFIWLSSHQNWYEGIAHNTPSHNNGLESNNLVIKKEETFRERMPLSRFLQQCILSGEKWSKQYSHNDKVFIDSPAIELRHWTAGYHWAQTNKEISSTAIG